MQKSSLVSHGRDMKKHTRHFTSSLIQWRDKLFFSGKKACFFFVSDVLSFKSHLPCCDSWGGSAHTVDRRVTLTRCKPGRLRTTPKKKRTQKMTLAHIPYAKSLKRVKNGEAAAAAAVCTCVYMCLHAPKYVAKCKSNKFCICTWKYCTTYIVKYVYVRTYGEPDMP